MRHLYCCILLSLGVLLAIVPTDALAQQDETTILWYKFDVPFKADIEDLSLYENHGQITGDVEFEEEGKVGGAARFTPGAQITVFNSDSLNVETNLTIEFWIQPDDVPAATYWRLVHKGWADPGSYICGIDNNWMALGYTWDVNNTAGVRTDANKANAVVAETWQYFAATYDGEQIILYVDGEVAVQTAAGGDIDGAANIVIAETYSGLLDEIRFSNVALSQEEIQQHSEGQDTHAVDATEKLATRWAKVKQ